MMCRLLGGCRVFSVGMIHFHFLVIEILGDCAVCIFDFNYLVPLPKSAIALLIVSPPSCVQYISSTPLHAFLPLVYIVFASMHLPQSKLLLATTSAGRGLVGQLLIGPMGFCLQKTDSDLEHLHCQLIVLV